MRGEAGFRYGSVCSGIEAASVAWHPLGWRASFLSEIEPFPRAVLKHHYPETPLHGDFTTIQAGEYEPIDLLVGGTPCQSFSVAGLRGGLADDRGNLALEYLRLADRLRPRWLVWENVPGVLSSDGGRDFGAILGGMVELGYGFAYRVLDAQFFGVAQRRRRVFVVGYLGDWRRAAAVLFERHGLSGHPSPRRQKGQSAPTIPSRSSAGGGLGTDFDCDGGLIQAFGGNDTRGPIEVATACNAHGGPMGRMDFESETFVTQPICFSSKDHGADFEMDLSPTLRAGGHNNSHANAGVPPAIAFGWQNSASQGDGVGEIVSTLDKSKTPAIVQPIVLMERGRDGSPNLEYRQDGTANAILTPNGGRGGLGVGAVAFNITPSNSNKDYNARPSERAQAITSGGNRPSARGGDLIAGTVRSHTRPGSNEIGSIVQTSAVRRLTPRECERLQGFKDNYTLIPWRNGMAPDGPRYKALGNSMAVPCMAWLGRRIEAVEALTAQEDAA